MSWKDSKDFCNNYTSRYYKIGDVYDGNVNRVGYVACDGDYCINNDNSNYGQLYHNKD